MVAKITIEGVPEVTHAFDKVASSVQDLSEAHKAEADMLLPDVLSATRKLSGDLAAGWQTDGIATQAVFSNDVIYAPIQEFGWSDHNIEPTAAIAQAFEGNQENTGALYGDAIRAIGDRAGFHTE
jgi:hypothetical protein